MYIYKVKTELIPIDKAIIDNNPEFFEVIDWKAELLTFMRAEKMPQPAQLGKKLIPFFEDMIMSSIQQTSGTSVDPNLMREIDRRDSELNSFKRELDRKDSDLDSLLVSVLVTLDSSSVDSVLLENSLLKSAPTFTPHRLR